MKKLMFSLAIAAVGSALAVESSNIVGYSQKTTGSFSPISAPFVDIAGTEVFTFGDYVVNCDEEDPDATTGWLANNDTFNTYTAAGLFAGAYIYCPQWLAEALTEEFGYTVVPGWYSTSDEEFKTCCNNIEIPFGCGTIAKAASTGAYVTFAGQVKKTPTVTDIGAFTIAGNVSPKGITVGDIVVNCDEEDPDATTGWLANNDVINLYTAAGLFDRGLIYCPAWLAEALTEEFGYSVTPGWYATTDEEFTQNLNDTVSFAAGEGFVAKCSSTGATLTIASALAE